MKKRHSKDLNLVQRRSREFYATMSRLGMLEDFRALPIRPKNYEKLFRIPFPMPQVELADQVSGDPDYTSLMEIIRKRVKDGEVKIYPDLPGITVRQYASSWCRMVSLLAGLKEAGHQSPAFERLYQRFNEFEVEVAATVAVRVWWLVTDVLIRQTRFDQKMPCIALKWHQPLPGKSSILVTLDRIEPRIHQLSVDGELRRTFQCGGQPLELEACGVQCFDWIQWNVEDFGITGEEGPRPVVVQSHAIRNFLERIGLEHTDDVPFDWINHALRKPDIQKREGNAFYVAFRFDDLKLGYFIVKWTAGVFLVTTFLFLTMEGTPESELLHQRLKVRRNQIESMELDRLSTYIFSDVGEDHELAAALRDAGCGQLLDLRTMVKDNVETQPKSSIIRLILGMGPMRSNFPQTGVAPGGQVVRLGTR